MVLFAVIDITGSIPIIIDIKRKTGHIDAERATLVSFVLMLLFLFAGEPFLNLFGVDVSSFAIAGSFVLLLLGMEMVLGIEFFKYESQKQTSIVPLAFPLIAGAGSLDDHSFPESGVQCLDDSDRPDSEYDCRIYCTKGHPYRRKITGYHRNSGTEKNFR